MVFVLFCMTTLTDLTVAFPPAGVTHRAGVEDKLKPHVSHTDHRDTKVKHALRQVLSEVAAETSVHVQVTSRLNQTTVNYSQTLTDTTLPPLPDTAERIGNTIQTAGRLTNRRLKSGGTGKGGRKALRKASIMFHKTQTTQHRKQKKKHPRVNRITRLHDGPFP